MEAQDMTDDLKHPCPDVTFATIGDDTITTLTTLSNIFTKKLNNTPVQATTTEPINATENQQPAALVLTVLTYPVKHNHQTIFQTQSNP